MRAAQRRQVSLVFGWSSMPDYWRSRVPARNREYRTPRVGRSHFGGGGSGSRSAVPTYPQPPHKWTTSPDSGRTGGSLRASRIASPHWGHRGADSGSFRTSMHGSQCGEHFRPRRSTGQYCSLTCRKASARSRAVSVPRTQRGRYRALVSPARWGWRGLSRSARYRSGRSPDWLKFKNPAAPAVKREAEEDWGR